MEIKVGEYVKTIHGEIAIFKGWNNNPKSQWSCKLEFQKIKTWKYCCEEYIVKHSFNIIDLIEVGDYVNGKKVIMDLQKSKEWYKSKDDFITCKDYTFEEKEIKTIVTKEQFNNIKYEV